MNEFLKIKSKEEMEEIFKGNRNMWEKINSTHYQLVNIPDAEQRQCAYQNLFFDEDFINKTYQESAILVTNEVMDGGCIYYNRLDTCTEAVLEWAFNMLDEKYEILVWTERKCKKSSMVKLSLELIERR